MNRIAILGASRGLGWAVYTDLISLNKKNSFFLSSRTIDKKNNSISENTIIKSQDFSKLPVSSDFTNDLIKFNPTHLIYMAGGGPYGEFQTKKWSDHLWSINTTFLYPAELLHQILSSPQDWSGLIQVIFVGSAVAESQPDPSAASYAAAKHALKGLISSVQNESLKSPEILLFSPGYMQTELLPLTSWPVQQGLAEDVLQVSKKLITLLRIK